MEKESLPDKKIMKNLHFILTLISLLLAIFAAVPQLISLCHIRRHNLEISIPDLKVNEKYFIIPMIFKNNGDYGEILTSISLDFFNGESHVLQLAETDNIFLFQKKSDYKKIFETRIDFQEKDMHFYEYLLGNKMLSLELVFEFAYEENKHVTTRIKLGDVSINEDITKFDMQISIPFKEINLSNAKEKVIIENYPRTIEYDAFKLVERK